MRGWPTLAVPVHCCLVDCLKHVLGLQAGAGRGPSTPQRHVHQLLIAVQPCEYKLSSIKQHVQLVLAALHYLLSTNSTIKMSARADLSSGGSGRPPLLLAVASSCPVQGQSFQLELPSSLLRGKLGSVTAHACPCLPLGHLPLWLWNKSQAPPTLGGEG